MDLGTFVGGSRGVHAVTGKESYSFDVVDLDAGTMHRIDLPFLPHGFTRLPTARHVAAVFEKRGPGAALLDLRTMRRLGRLVGKRGRHFYGHGVYSREGDRLFVVETELATGKGVLGVRETTGYKEVETFPTYGDRPHDCVPIDEGKVLAITNGGGALDGDAPCVCFIDVASCKLLEKVPLPAPELNAGHVAIGCDGSLAIVSAPRDGLPPATSPGGVSLRRAGDPHASRARGPSDVMAKIIGESLSVCIDDERRVVGVTHPFGSIVTFWSIATRELLATHACESPRGIELTRDRSSFVVSLGKLGTVQLIDAQTLRPIERSFGAGCLGGSHIFPLW
jgi:hypothetical protein